MSTCNSFVNLLKTVLITLELVIILKILCIGIEVRNQTFAYIFREKVLKESHIRRLFQVLRVLNFKTLLTPFKSMN